MHGRVTHRWLLRVVTLILPGVLLLSATAPAASDRCVQYADAYIVCLPSPQQPVPSPG